MSASSEVTVDFITANIVVETPIEQDAGGSIIRKQKGIHKIIINYIFDVLYGNFSALGMLYGYSGFPKDSSGRCHTQIITYIITDFTPIELINMLTKTYGPHFF